MDKDQHSFLPRSSNPNTNQRGLLNPERSLKRHANMELVPYEARCRGSHQIVCDLVVERGKKEFPLKHSAVLDVYHGENGLRSLGINIHSAHQRHK